MLQRLGNKPNIKYMQLNLSSQNSVRRFVSDYRNDSHPPLRYLLLNAGMENFNGGLPVNEDGIEMTFAVNHFGHFLLFQLLRPYFDPTHTRITVTSSATHDAAQKTVVPPPRYSIGSTLATVKPTEGAGGDCNQCGRGQKTLHHQ